MKHIKKLSAVLIAVMLISMLSCFAFSANAASELGGPVSIEKIVAGAGEVAVTGKPLPNGIMVVNGDWKGERGTRTLKLGGIAYSAVIGTNGFATIGDAIAMASGYETIYVAAGEYEDSVAVNVGGLKIYGPYAGVRPNLGTAAVELAAPNPARPSAAGGDTADEAVILGTFSLSKAGSDLTVDGLYFSGGGGFNSNLPDSENYRYGTVVQNCVINTTRGQFFSFSAGNHGAFEFKNNRVLKGKGILSITGMMDAAITDNYLNLSEVTMTMLWVTAGSMGTYAKIANNYYENCGGMFYYDNQYQTLLYSVMVQDNYVNNMGAAPIVYNMFYARNTLPGTNIQVTGNTFLGMEKGVTAFEFPYVASQDNPNRFRHIININENHFDIPADTMFVESDMNGVLNLANNYYSSPISVDRVTKYESTDLILYPYYEDPAMTTLKGGATLSSDDPRAEVDHAQKLITFDCYGTEQTALDMAKALVAEEGCTWKLYEEETLITEIKDKMFYFDGTVTERYAKVVAADGVTTNIYKIRALHDTGTAANLIGLVFDSVQVSSATIEGTNFTYNFPADLAFADYEVKVSSGATYELYKSYSQDGTTEAFPEIGNYIPYGGFEFDIVVTAEDGVDGGAPAKQVYHVTFNRDKSAYYDPSVIDVIAPEGGRFEIRKDALNAGQLQATYYCPYLLKTATFDLAVTPGATYVIYEDAALTKELSSSSNKKEIKLADGASTLYVKVSSGDGSNVIPFNIQNVAMSSDATITGMTGLSARINNNEITIQSGGASVSVNFITRNKYATVKVFADAGKTVAVDYTSTPTEDREHPNQIIDDRTFQLDITHAVSYYYVECTAEDGTIKDYKLIVNKIVQTKEYADVTDEDWFYDCVTEASNAGILQGSQYGQSNIFRPNENTTRQEMAVIAARLLGINSGAFEKIALPYKDAASIADWALGYVKVAYKTGIMKGDGQNFNPNANISREQVMAMFARMYNLTGSADLTRFADYAQISAWAKPEVEAVVATGLVEGDNGYLKPQNPITRAEIAAIISRVI